ncbi:hypothetical protein B9Z55_008033 [Caenorhabditis nigoni]|uniref:Uncharacterized protein n=1 Tax=Caenorhabditis nigoni TaxID=1611254 RepID=A0A2G5VCB0_9PELO|nr:hypothetical protein B9Z55_008033 [Caenorhabditis nigoni]
MMSQEPPMMVLNQQIQLELRRLSPQRRNTLAEHMQMLQNFPDKCSEIPLTDPNLGIFLAVVLDNLWEDKIPFDRIKEFSSYISGCGLKQKEFLEMQCEQYMTTKSYKNNIADSFGYGVCCEGLKMCTLEAIAQKYVKKFSRYKSCSDIPPDFFTEKKGKRYLYLAAFEVKTPSDFIKDKESFSSNCTAKEKKEIEEACNKFYENSVKSEDQEIVGYDFCCKTMGNNCRPPFYTQIWFFAICGGVGLLLIGIIGVVVYFFCIRKKRGGGKSGGGMKSSKKSTKNSKSKSEALF